MLKPEMLKKKKITMYKAFHMVPGESMNINPNGDTFFTNKKDAIIEHLSTIKEISELEKMKNSELMLVELTFTVSKLLSNPKSEDILQDGNQIWIVLNDYPQPVGYRMNLATIILKDFTYDANPKDQGASLVFSNITIEEKDK